MDNNICKLLLISCSKRKKGNTAPTPALSLYDGTHYRVLRKFLGACGWPAELKIKILSSKHGLIDATQPIARYDQRMTHLRACELHDETVNQLQRTLEKGSVKEVFISLAGPYLDAIIGWDTCASPDTNIEYASGPIGARASQLKTWLMGGRLGQHLGTQLSSDLPIVFRGKVLSLSKIDIIRIAKENLHRDPRARAFHTCFVRIGNERVASKWLISLATGVPVHDFRTEDAVYLLRRFGFVVHRL